jgi:3-dehydroquinate synthase
MSINGLSRITPLSDIILNETQLIQVELGDRTYPVILGSGIRTHFAEYFSQYGCGRPFWVTDRNVDKAWGHYLFDIRKSPPKSHVVLPAGEDQKKLTTVEALCRQWIHAEVDRGDCAIALGGGVVGDLVGFAAACYQRGIPFVQVPTTLLAMVDASVGGKTGVDLPEGKNLVGAFHQPRFVLIDTDFLQTLPERRIRDGYAEIFKTALIGDPALFRFLNNSGQAAILEGRKEALLSAISACIRFKAKIVAEDEREGDRRRILNFGHTFGHALELLGKFEILTHGEALLWGLYAALSLSLKKQLLSPGLFDDILSLLEPLLEQVPPIPFQPEEVHAMMKRDKKVHAGQIHFVLLKTLGEPVITSDISREDIFQVLVELKDKMSRL